MRKFKARSVQRYAVIKIIIFAWLIALSTPTWSEEPQIVSKYESHVGCCGPFPDWLVPHSGVDFSGRFGDDVIAPADAVVVNHIAANPATCGKTVALFHSKFQRYTVYCHFQDVKVRVGDYVKRGDVIGTLGDTGVAGNCRRIRACPIVHMELSTVPHGHPRAKAGETFNVLALSVGCFDPRKKYATDRLVLTYPVRCTHSR